MYYITAASSDKTMFEITDCLTKHTSVITDKKLAERDDVFGDSIHKYYSCTEVPDEGELELLLEEYPNGIKHTENSRFFLFIPISEVRTISKPMYVITRYKGDGNGPWKLFMLHKSDSGATRVPELAYQTDDKGEAIRKANSINDLYTKNKWTPANYKVMTLVEALAQISKEERML